MFVVSFEFFGHMGTGDRKHGTIVYLTDTEANKAVDTLTELSNIAYEVNEDVDPANRPQHYAHLMSQIQELDLESVLVKLFDEELEIGSILTTSSPIGKLILA